MEFILWYNVIRILTRDDDIPSIIINGAREPVIYLGLRNSRST